jgi:hypothetical protein
MPRGGTAPVEQQDIERLLAPLERMVALLERIDKRLKHLEELNDPSFQDGY